MQTRALRDTGYQIAVTVEERFVKLEQLDHGRIVLCSGAFDNGLQRSLPTADITTGSPRFVSNEDVKIRVPCVIGNQFFAMNSHLTDILEVKKVTDAERDRTRADAETIKKSNRSQ